MKKTHLSKEDGKCLVVTSKTWKSWVKKRKSHPERDDTTYYLFQLPQQTRYHHKRISQSNFTFGTIYLQKESGHGPKIQDVVVPRQTKRPCIVIYDSQKEFLNIWENKKTFCDWTIIFWTWNTVYWINEFTTTICKDKLQEQLSDISDLLKKTIV